MLDITANNLYNESMIITDGKSLRAWRISQGLTMDELAQRLGRNYYSISKYETGNRKVPRLLSLAISQLSLQEEARKKFVESETAEMTIKKHQVPLPMKVSTKRKRK